jgi:hypothetical protein
VASIVQTLSNFSRRDILDNFILISLLGDTNANNISKKTRHAYIKPSSIVVNSKRGEKTTHGRTT